MKLFKILSHPYTLIISFLIILISGEHLGGFYVLYILLALPHGGIHSILALAGIIILLVNHLQPMHQKKLGRNGLLNFSGLALLLASIILFFLNDRQHYNWGTFDQTIPLLTIIMFSAFACCFIIDNSGINNLTEKMNHRVQSKA